MAKSPKKLYFVLGEKASIFWDPIAKLKVITKDQSNPEPFEGTITKQMELAIGAGHIVKLDAPIPSGQVLEEDDEEEEVEVPNAPLIEGPATQENLSALDDEQLTKYYQENFDVSKADLKKFKALTKEQKVAFILED